ncbi:probable ATP-dependent RNA helicase DDX46 [Hydra vulgaris]|nr:probable ATP-dependent RNA helicase DDX46 [Hydra vulgaris]
MKSAKKTKKRGRSVSPKSEDKPKRRYRNDRSKKWQANSSESSESSDEESMSSDESHKNSKYSKKKDSSSERSISPDYSVVEKKKIKKSQPSSEEELQSKEKIVPKVKTKTKEKSPSSIKANEKENKQSKDKKRRSISTEKIKANINQVLQESSKHIKSHKKEKEKEKSISPKRERKKGRSQSPPKKKKAKSRSPSRHKRSRTKSPIKVKRSKSKSPSRRNKSKSRSPSRRKRSKSRSPSRRKRSKSRSPSRRNRSKSRSPSRRNRTKSRSPTRRKKSKSPISKKRTKSRSPTSKRKRSKSPSKRRRSRSLSRQKDSKSSTQKSNKSRSPSTNKKSFSKSPIRRRRSRSPRNRKLSKSLSKSPSRSKRSKSRSPSKSKKSKSKSPSRKSKSNDKKKVSKTTKEDENKKEKTGNITSKDEEKKEKSSKNENNDEKIIASESKAVIADYEEEMRKRKERIEEWRKSRTKKPENDADLTAATLENDSKKWTLEDDDEDEEVAENSEVTKVKKEDNDQVDEKSSELNEEKNIKVEKISDVEPKIEEESKTSLKIDNEVQNKTLLKDEKSTLVEEKTDEEEAEEDLDPLDAYMKSIDKQVGKVTAKKIKKSVQRSVAETVMVVKTVIKKTENVKVKPEVIEQNQDALEYSSEEEESLDVTAGDFSEVRKKKKELTVADHTKIYYPPFRRAFYVEVPELAKMTQEEVKLYRESLGDIQVRGKSIPKPIKTWSQAGVSTKVLAVLKKLKYEKPTPIQAQAIPAIMSGRDLIGIAKTGSGKTLAFLIPLFRHVIDQPPLDENDGPIAIIMTPTRELALQIFREAKKFCKQLNLTAACIYGGSGISEQIAELKKGAEIIVCTPGRMIDMLTANNGRVTNCRRCTYLVMDEADRMFDMGFEPQVMRILDNIRPDRQTVLFSATFPRQMEAIARKVLNKPIEVQVGGRSVVCSDVEQHALVIEEENKFFKLLELLGVYQEKGSVLVFVEKQESADMLFKDLLKNAYPCLSLHGGMDQFDRDSTIADFKNGVTKLMVSTSVAARGLDVKNLVLVLNYDCPNHYEDYVHRVGRTGRAGNKGTSFTFITPEQGRNAGDIIKAFELAKCTPPTDVMELWNKFKLEMQLAGKTLKSNCGFSGKGFKFNADEEIQVSDAKKMQKFSLGLQDSDDEAEAAESAMDKIEADLEKAFSNKPKIALAPEVVEAQKVKAAEQNVDKGKLKQASHIAALINKKLHSGQVVDRNTQATAHILHGGALESLTGVGLAKQLADKVNAKLNYKAVEPEKSDLEAKPNNVRYEDEIDINDFPQQARWRITSKEVIEQVRELSESGVTVRGLYIPPNKKPEGDEKRLHLYLESLSERSIQIAKAEIKRLLREELIRAESHSYKPQQQTGRYKVL